MARSRKKLPYVGACADSDRASKTLAHHQERRAAKNALKREEDIPASKTFGDPWNGDKDGKIWVGYENAESLRK
ncbi:hypothetical protein [Rhizobium phaseoli]|uniref:Uncharacterized protein n=1 Tax=Rhizobium phaseoli TaxID=396 RepID=A0ABM6CFL9_9HYPH|nr:hypothetical protein [Rhizobium phaseoli]ANL87047.1 hypothetical protein AMC81_PA00023 [Rhizobium phaseoli]ANL93556.1 hypothetical protein AMC80_PA00023 [Rhizobium phaseoli]